MLMRSLVLITSLLLFGSESSSQIMFNKTINGVASGGATDVIVTSDNGYLIAGGINTFKQYARGSYFIKTDSTGSIEWTKTYQRAGLGALYSIQKTSDGGYISSGDSLSLLKTDINGDVQWSKSYTNYSTGWAAIQTSDGGYITVAGGFGPIITKCDNAGNPIWVKRYFDTVGFQTVYALSRSICPTSDGGFIIFGYIGIVSDDGLVSIKVANDGALQWLKVYKAATNLAGTSMIQTQDGGFLSIGYRRSGGPASIHAIKMDGGGNVQWARSYEGLEAHSVQPTYDGGYIIAGCVGTSNGTPSLLKIDVSGNAVWSKAYRSFNKARARSVKETPDHGFIVTGQTGDNAEILFLKTDANGNSGCNDSTITSMDTFFSVTVADVPPYSYPDTVANLDFVYTIGTGGIDSTICSTLSVANEQVSSAPTTVFPNPTAGAFTIKSSEVIKCVTIYSPSGTVVFNATFNSRDAEIDLHELTSGLYLYTALLASGKAHRGKIILK